MARPTASSSKFFQAATQADFLKGDVENLSIDSQGRLMLGPATELVYETVRAVSLVGRRRAPTDRCLSAPGMKARSSASIRRARAPLFFDAPEIEVHALAPAPNGGLYVATSPDGRIYKVDRDGKATTFFDPGRQVHLVAGGRFARATCSRAPARKA